jgi:excisionase family DNA binding protein
MPAAVRVPAADPKLLTLHDVCRRLRLGHSKVYALIKEGRFPAPLKVGRVSRWVTREVDAWVEDQIAASER